MHSIDSSCSDCGGHSHSHSHLHRPAPAHPLLRLQNVGVRYRPSPDWAIHGIDLEIGAGEIICLVGPNGAGKTSLLRAIASLQPISQGSISWVGPRQAVGYVPQQSALDRHLPISVLEFLSLKLNPTSHWSWLRRPQPSAQAQALATLEEMGVAALSERRLGELSGGELQRVLIAYSLIGDPRLLLLDEPMTGVDVKGGREFQDLIGALRRDRGIAIVMVSHDLHMVGAISDIVVCLNRHLCSTGTPAEVLQEHILSSIYGSPLGLPVLTGKGAAGIA